MATRMKPEARKADILDAAIKAAEKHGFAKVRAADIATQAGCSYGNVYLYFKTMPQMRSAIMRAAIKQANIKIIAEGIGCGNPQAKKAPPDLKEKAIAYLSN